MDPITNPFAPGAGTPPPELAGRDDLREMVRIAIERVRLGHPARSVMMVGLRGVGKTVVLDRMRDDAEATGAHTVRMEAPEGRSLPGLLAPQLRGALLRLSQIEKAKAYATRGLRALAGFVKAFKLKHSDIEVSLDLEPEPGLADNGDLEQDLQALFEEVGRAAQSAGTTFALFIDELQYVPEEQLAALITALHRCAQAKLPVILIGAGLPQLRGRMGNAKSYAERLFEFREVGPLQGEEVRRAVIKPLLDQGADVEPDAFDQIVVATHGYPYFLQEWGKHAWDIAARSPITKDDVLRATVIAIAALDVSFFRVRSDRVSPLERKYLRAMAELGAGPHRSGAIAEELARGVTGLAPTRFALIKKGMIWSPSHGDTAFTVPMFDEYMRRIMPGQDWR
jgi:hypothetical protein